MVETNLTASISKLRQLQQLKELSSSMSSSLDDVLNFINLKTSMLERSFASAESNKKNFTPDKIASLVTSVLNKVKTKNSLIQEEEVKEVIKFFISQVIEVSPGGHPYQAEALEEIIESVSALMLTDQDAALYIASIQVKKLVGLLKKEKVYLNKLLQLLDLIEKSSLKLSNVDEINRLSEISNMANLLKSNTNTEGIGYIIGKLDGYSDLCSESSSGFLSIFVDIRLLFKDLLDNHQKILNSITRIKESLNDFEETSTDLGGRISKLILAKFDSLTAILKNYQASESVTKEARRILNYFATGKELLENFAAPVSPRGTTIYNDMAVLNGQGRVSLDVAGVEVGDRLMIACYDLPDGTTVVPTSTLAASGYSASADFSFGSYEVTVVNPYGNFVRTDPICHEKGTYKCLIYRDGSIYWGHLWAIIQLLNTKFNLPGFDKIQNDSSSLNYLVGRTGGALWKRFSVLVGDLLSSTDEADLTVEINEYVNKLTDLIAFCEEFDLPEIGSVKSLLWYLYDIGAIRLAEFLLDGKYSEFLTLDITGSSNIENLINEVSSSLSTDI